MKRTFFIGCFAMLGLLMSACAAQTGEEGAVDPGDNEDVAETSSALLPGRWTPATSEELPPAFCDDHQIVDQIKCFGNNCDDVSLHCGSLGNGVSVTNLHTSNWFSEELPNNLATCGQDRFMVGVECFGNLCDDMRITCATFSNKKWGAGCFWTTDFSEEGTGTVALPNNFAAAGIQCFGNNCDNLKVFACPMK